MLLQNTIHEAAEGDGDSGCFEFLGQWRMVLDNRQINHRVTLFQGFLDCAFGSGASVDPRANHGQRRRDDRQANCASVSARFLRGT